MRGRLKPLFCVILLGFSAGAAAREPRFLGMSYENLIIYYPGFNVVAVEPTGGSAFSNYEHINARYGSVDAYISSLKGQFMDMFMGKAKKLAKDSGGSFYGVSGFHIQYELNESQVVVESGADILALRKK